MKTSSQLVNDATVAMSECLGINQDELDNILKETIRKYVIGETGLLHAVRQLEDSGVSNQTIECFIHAVCPWLNSGFSNV